MRKGKQMRYALSSLHLTTYRVSRLLRQGAKFVQSGQGDKSFQDKVPNKRKILHREKALEICRVLPEASAENLTVCASKETTQKLGVKSFKRMRRNSIQSSGGTIVCGPTRQRERTL